MQFTVFFHSYLKPPKAVEADGRDSDPAATSPENPAIGGPSTCEETSGLEPDPLPRRRSSRCVRGPEHSREWRERAHRWPKAEPDPPQQSRQERPGEGRARAGAGSENRGSPRRAALGTG